MSRIKEALVFKTDEERLEWFNSLTPEEQAEVTKEANELVDKTIEVFRPVAEALAKAFVLWFDLGYKNFLELSAAIVMAQANNARNRRGTRRGAKVVKSKSKVRVGRTHG